MQSSSRNNANRATPVHETPGGQGDNQEVLQLVWLSAILCMRRAKKSRADHCERWRDIDDIGLELGFPPAPLGLI